MKGQTADVKYTYIFSKPNKWGTEITQYMLVSHKEMMY